MVHLGCFFVTPENAGRSLGAAVATLTPSERSAVSWQPSAV